MTAAYYSPTGAFLYQTSGVSCPQLVGGCNFLTTNTGVGNSGYVFQLDAAQQAQAIAAGVFNNQNNLVGLSASASNVNGGNETFYLGVVGAAGPTPVPEPTTWALSLAGVILVGFSSLRRRSARRS
jgi:hypothetical protein